MDCFYAAVEMRDRPDLRNRPMAVGGRPEGRGVITTANYKAREFGVRSALSAREALRRCPDLVILPNRFAKYREVSQQIRTIMAEYADIIEPLSLDEAYLDVTGNEKYGGSATQTARALRDQIFKETELTASAGISNSKFLAKVASDWKKPNGQFTIPPQSIPAFIKKLPLGKIPGVGKATLVKLHSRGFYNCGDLQELNLDELSFQFGRFGDRLYDLCRGVDHSAVKPSRQRKSISVETTFSKDISQWKDLQKSVEKLFEELQMRMTQARISQDKIKSIGVKLKSSDFQIATKEKSMPFCKDSFLELAKEHFHQCNFSVRLIGISGKLSVKKQQRKSHQLSLLHT